MTFAQKIDRGKLRKKNQLEARAVTLVEMHWQRQYGEDEEEQLSSREIYRARKKSFYR